MHIVPIFFLFSALTLCSPVFAQTMYKWVDAQGTTHYSYEPPADLAYEVVDPDRGLVSYVPAPEFQPADDEEHRTAALMDPVSRARHCRMLEERMRWLLARRDDMLEEFYDREEVLDDELRAGLIEELGAELDRDCGT